MSTSRKSSTDSNNSDSFVDVGKEEESEHELDSDEQNAALQSELEKLKEELRLAKEQAQALQASQLEREAEAKKLKDDLEIKQQSEQKLQEELLQIKQQASQSQLENQRVLSELKSLNETVQKEKEKYSKLEEKTSHDLDSINNQYGSQKRKQAAQIIQRAYYNFKTKKIYTDLSSFFGTVRIKIQNEKAVFRSEQKQLNDEMIKLAQGASSKESMVKRDERDNKISAILQKKATSYSTYAEKLQPLHQEFVAALNISRTPIRNRPKKWVALSQKITETKKSLSDLLVKEKRERENYLNKNFMIFGGTVYVKLKEFHQAIQDGNFKLAEKHLAQGADINALRQDGLSPLFFELSRDRSSFHGSQVEWLINHGADLKQKVISAFRSLDGKDITVGSTPIHVLANLWKIEGNGGKVSSALALLVAKGADINAKDINGDTPLHLSACFSGNQVSMDTLIKHKANPKELNNNGKTPEKIYEEVSNRNRCGRGSYY